MKTVTLVLCAVLLVAEPALADRNHSPEAFQDARGRVHVEAEDVASIQVVSPCHLCLHLSDVYLADHILYAHPGRERVIIHGEDGSSTMFEGVKRLKIHR